MGIVGGSDLKKIAEQIGANVTTDYDYVFSENGLLAHKAGEEIGRADIKVKFYAGARKEGSHKPGCALGS